MWFPFFFHDFHSIFFPTAPFSSLCLAYAQRKLILKSIKVGYISFHIYPKRIFEVQNFFFVWTSGHTPVGRISMHGTIWWRKKNVQPQRHFIQSRMKYKFVVCQRWIPKSFSVCCFFYVIMKAVKRKRKELGNLFLFLRGRIVWTTVSAAEGWIKVQFKNTKKKKAYSSQGLVCLDFFSHFSSFSLESECCIYPFCLVQQGISESFLAPLCAVIRLVSLPYLLSSRNSCSYHFRLR